MSGITSNKHVSREKTRTEVAFVPEDRALHVQPCSIVNNLVEAANSQVTENFSHIHCHYRQNDTIHPTN